MFQNDTRGQKDFKKVLRKLPRRLEYAAMFTLNDFAFGARKSYVKIIDTDMTARSPKFIKGRMRAQKVRFSHGLKGAQSMAGSIRADRFTGWREQVTGADMPRDRAITPAARRGTITNRVAPSARLKPGNKFISPQKYRARTPFERRNRANAMVQHLARTKYRKPFFVHGHPKIQPGLWKFVGGKLKPLQLFKRTVPVGKMLWHIKGTHRYFKKHPPRITYIKRAKEQIKKMTGSA